MYGIFIQNLNTLWYLKSKIKNYFDELELQGPFVDKRPDPDPQHWYKQIIPDIIMILKKYQNTSLLCKLPDLGLSQAFWNCSSVDVQCGLRITSLLLTPFIDKDYKFTLREGVKNILFNMSEKEK